MGTEAAPVLFGVPFAICLVALILTALSERKKSYERERGLGLGRGRLAWGYLGVLGAFLLFCFVAASLEQSLDMTLPYFYVFGLLLIIIMTLIFLPLLALLRWMGFASVLGVLCASLLIAIGVGLFPGSEVVASAIVGSLLGLAFAVSARLPLVRSRGDL